jgi:hypothetical protein
MDQDEKYLPNYKPDTLYVHPSAGGAYASLVSDGEKFLSEVDVSPRTKSRSQFSIQRKIKAV